MKYPILYVGDRRGGAILTIKLIEEADTWQEAFRKAQDTLDVLSRDIEHMPKHGQGGIIYVLHRVLDIMDVLEPTAEALFQDLASLFEGTPGPEWVEIVTKLREVRDRLPTIPA